MDTVQSDKPSRPLLISESRLRFVHIKRRPSKRNYRLVWNIYEGFYYSLCVNSALWATRVACRQTGPWPCCPFPRPGSRHNSAPHTRTADPRLKPNLEMALRNHFTSTVLAQPTTTKRWLQLHLQYVLRVVLYCCVRTMCIFRSNTVFELSSTVRSSWVFDLNKQK